MDAKNVLLASCEPAPSQACAQAENDEDEGVILFLAATLTHSKAIHSSNVEAISSAVATARFVAKTGLRSRIRVEFSRSHLVHVLHVKSFFMLLVLI